MLRQLPWRKPRRIAVNLLKGLTFLRHQSTVTEKSNIWTDRFIEEEKDGKAPADALKYNLPILAVKDNIATSEGFTTCASKILADHKSPFEASVVARLRQENAQLLGKTNLDEFGMGSHSMNTHFGIVENQWSYDGRSAGGSSGGSAMAVASGEASVALGTDTGGSVRLPAAYTGTVGFKPSYGLISRWGVVPYANSLDTVGIIASDVKTVAKTFQSLNFYDAKDPTSLTETFRRRASNNQVLAFRGSSFSKRNSDLSGLTFGVPAEYNIAEMDDSVRQAWEETLRILQDDGATIVPVSLPNTKQALSAYYILAPAEAASNLAKYDGVRYGSRNKDLWDGRGDVLYSETRGDGFGEEAKRRILLGSYTLSSDAIDNYFIKAQKIRRLVQQDFDRVFKIPNALHEAEQYDLSEMEESIELENKLGPTQVDFIITPTAPTLPPKLEDIRNQTPIDAYMNDVFTVPASLAGVPAISIPFACDEGWHQDVPDGGFMGIQIIAQHSDDNSLLEVAGLLSNRIDQRTPLMWRVFDGLFPEKAVELRGMAKCLQGFSENIECQDL